MNIIYLFQVILGILLVLIILVQQKGSGVGGAFGGQMALYRTKRGAEKLMFRITIFLALLFIVSSILGLVL